MEDVFVHHLPHFCWFILHTLCSQELLNVKPRSLQHCLELLTFSANKIAEEATPTPSTPATSTGGGKESAAATGSALTSHADKLKWKLLAQFSAFFSRFLNTRICDVRNHGDNTVDHTHSWSAVMSSDGRKRLSESMEKCFVVGCQLLCLLAHIPLSQSSAGDDKDSVGTGWLLGMKSVCTGSHDYHMTFTALETLLTLLAYSRANGSLSHDQSHDMRAVSVLCPELSTITKDTVFIESVTKYLWSCLGPSESVLHVEASSLLCWTHTLSLSHTCETTLLREFTTESIDVYQRFAALWQNSPELVHGIPSRPFNRALLRMVEGLQSRDAAIRGLVQAWVHSTTTRDNLQSLIAPLIRIILDQEDKRKAYTGQPSDKGLVEDAGKYYYSPVVSDRSYDRLPQDEEMRLIYMQVLDTDQVLYALSLIQAILFVDPATVIRSLTGSLVSVGTYGYVSMGNLAPKSDPSTGQKSLLEIILLSLSAFIRSDYPNTLDITSHDVVENLRVKAAAVEMMSFLTLQFSHILSSDSTSDAKTSLPTSTGGSSSSKGLIHNPSYVSALVTLCDVQKVLLICLSQVVNQLSQSTTTLSTATDPGDEIEGAPVICEDNQTNTSPAGGSERRAEVNWVPGIPLRVLFVHLLRCLHNLISLETQCIPSSPAAMTPSAKFTKRSLSSGGNLIQPGLGTAAQPFFQSLVMEILSSSSLADLHPPLLHMFSATLPNLGAHLDDLAPKILRQLCRDLEAGVQAEKTASERVSSRESGPSLEGVSGGMAVVSNIQALVNIIHCCLFGEYPAQRVVLRHNTLNRFWDASRLGRDEVSEEVSSPTSKQPSTMSWLLGVFATTTQSKTVSSPVGAKSLKLGLSQNRMGHSILLLLPAVYNALTEVWTWFSSRTPPTSAVGAISGSNDRGTSGRGRGGGLLETEKKRAEYEDIQSLVLSLLGPLAVHESTTFLSSVSTVWLEWDLGSKVNPSSKKMSKRKDSFIVMLHHIKVLSLEQFIRSVQFSFTDLARGDDTESSVLRQKYLLHFFYKYISSPHQSWEELAGCHTVMMMFLRDCYCQCYNSTSDSILTNCHLLCMLTSILHVYICRVPGLEKRQKKERKELQDLTHNLCEVLSMAAGCSPLPPPPPSPPPPPPPPPITPPTQTREMRTDQEEFEVVETSDLHSTQSKQHSHLSGEPGDACKTAATTATKSLGPLTTGVRKRGEHSSPNHMSASEDKRQITAGHVRSSIVPSVGHQSILTAAVRPAQLMKSAVDSSTLPGAQALAVLASTVSHFIDGVFGSSEKEKILALLKVVLHHVWPHLQNHSKEAQKLYHHAVKLLSSLSGFQATRKAWRRETFDLFMANNFFVMELDSLQEWKVLVDNLMTQDKTTFRDLLTRLAPGLAPGLSNIFTTTEQEALNTARVVKRMAFAILSAEVDQYTSYLPDIQEKLSDCLKLQRHPAVTSEVFLSFRTLLLRFSSTHLLSFWPAIIAETLSALQELEVDLSQELRGHRAVSADQLHLYLSVSKLLHTAWSLPSHFLPHFQFLQWGFSDVGSYHSSSSGLGMGPVHRICTLFSLVEGKGKRHLTNPPTGNHLHLHKITSLRDLSPLFTPLPSAPSNHHGDSSHLTGGGTRTSSQDTMQITSVEKELFRDFLEPFS